MSTFLTELIKAEHWFILSEKNQSCKSQQSTWGDNSRLNSGDHEYKCWKEGIERIRIGI